MSGDQDLRSVRLRIAALLVAACAASCASTVRVESLATGQPDRMAYQLFGAQLSDLRLRADELCPDGVEVWRAAEARQARVAAPGASRLTQWFHVAADAVTPGQAQAQLVVSCVGSAGGDAGSLSMLAPASGEAVAARGPRTTVAPRKSPGKAPVTDYD